MNVKHQTPSLTQMLAPDAGAAPVSMLTVLNPANSFEPLDRCRVQSQQTGTLTVRDGQGRIYHCAAIAGEAVFTVSGAVGSHLITLENDDHAILASASIAVTATTDLASDDDPRLADFMTKLRWNIAKGQEFQVVREDGEVRFLFSPWLRDHVHILKGKKYLHASVRDTIDLFARHQRSDGMLFDFYAPHEPGSRIGVNRFHDRGWTKLYEEETMFFQRVPVENDVEYLFVLGVFQTWQATGDEAWMAAKLDACLRAMAYASSDTLRWSTRHGLLKRGFTLDTWDWQPLADSRRVVDPMDITAEDTDFCIFHGDNTGFAHSCTLLAGMLEHAGREAEAPAWHQRGAEVMQRLDALAWNGSFYRHQVPEDPAVQRDLGVDPGEQVSLSNTFALGRNISEKQARAILATYRRIRSELPSEAQGEFISLYPPCTRGWHVRAGEYVNGGIFPFIGGELAAGAFRHGESAYGADLLARLYGLLSRYHGEFPYYWYTDLAPRDPGELRVIDIAALCNVGFGGGAADVPQWSGEGPENDFSLARPGEHCFHGIPSRVVDPATNRGAGCIGLHPSPGYLRSIDIPLSGRAGAFYLHHAMAGSADPLGWIDLRYADGTSGRIYMKPDLTIANWWNPQDCQGPTDRPYTGYHLRSAIVGDNRRARVGSTLWGFDNPHPGKDLVGLTCTHSQLNAYWFILGLTVGSGPRWLGTREARTGHLENWNAAAVLYALIEGRAGISDQSTGFSSAAISPRWAVAGPRHVRACAHYPASAGYCAYEYRRENERIHLRLAGSGDRRQVSVLLPACRGVTAVRVDGAARAFTLRQRGDDRYCDVVADGLAANELAIDLARGDTGNLNEYCVVTNQQREANQ